MVESVKSADRVLDVLTLLSKNMRGMTFTDICSELGWPKSSTHGLLATLQSRGFLDLNESDRRYSVGIRTWEVGQAYLGGQDLAQDALPYMQELCDDINETVQLAVLDGRENAHGNGDHYRRGEGRAHEKHRRRNALDDLLQDRPAIGE